MKVRKRQHKLVEIVRGSGRASVDELSEILGASRETIRRDLTELARLGKIEKFHGGATTPRVYGEGPLQQRLSQNAAAKMRVAEVAAKLFRPGDTLFVDTGSTTLYFAEELARESGFTVITNSAGVARIMTAPTSDNRTFLLGGEFSAGNQQTVGAMVSRQIAGFRAHHAVLTVGALDARTGAMDFNIEEALIAQAMIEQSESVTVLLEHSKFDAVASFEVCPLSRIARIVCDVSPPPPMARALKAAGVRLVVAPDTQES